MGNRWRSNRPWLAAVTVLAAIAGGATEAAAAVATTQARSGASIRITAAVQGRRATLKYLEAELRYQKDVVAAASASRGAVEALAGRLGSECPNVAAGIKAMLDASVGELRRSAQQSREEARRRRQWDDLTAEMRRTVELTRSQPYRQAALMFARKVDDLRWSNRDVTVYEHANAEAVEWEVDGAPLPVCADIEAWVQSGYTTLPPATTAFAHERTVTLRPLDRVVYRWSVAGLTDPLLHYEESPRAKVVAQHLANVSKQGARALGRVYTASRRIERMLGVISEAEAAELAESFKAWKRSRSGANVIGRGRVVGGGKYTILVEARKRGGSRGPGGDRTFEDLPASHSCRLQVDVLEEETLSGSRLTVTDEPEVACLSRSHPMAPRVRCEAERRAIEAQTQIGARSVRVTLADGHELLSRVLRVPRRLGGPAGFFYQAQLVWDSPPVALTELDRRGRPLRTVTLKHVPRCPEQWPYMKRGGDKGFSAHSFVEVGWV